MKTLWLILFTHSLAFAINSQVVVGNFLYEHNAKDIKNSLQKYMQQDKNFYNKHEIRATYKQKGQYFIVALGPIYESFTLFKTLQKVKPRFDGAYILELPLDSMETSAGEEETEVLQTAQAAQEVKKEVVTKTIVKEQNVIIKEEPNMLNQYQNEIIALIALLILSNIYFIIKRSQNTKQRFKESSLEETEEIELDDISNLNEKETLVIDNFEDIKIDNFDGAEEGTFAVEQEPTKEISKPAKAPKKPSIKKRTVPSHEKITKQHFKEFAGSKILVAEDNLINQKVITGLLADTGIEITLADDGQEALEILEKNSDFNFILMDAHMPRVDGFEATRIIKSKSEYDHIVIVALSGDTAADDVANMKNAGMQEHLEKPLRMDALYDILYAYTGYNHTNKDYIEVVATKELNGDKGLEICGGDEKFYNEILREFVATYENSKDKLSELLNRGDLVNADKLLLDIIGVTANIGADPLNVIAITIKEALKDTQEKSYLTLLEQYKEHLEELIADIKEYIY